MEINFYCIEISEVEPVHTVITNMVVGDYLNVLKQAEVLIIHDNLYKYLLSEFRIKEDDFSDDVLDVFITQK